MGIVQRVQRVHRVRVATRVGHDLGLPELGWDHVGFDLVPVFAGNVTADRVIASE